MVNKSQLFSKSTWITNPNMGKIYFDEFIEVEVIGKGTYIIKNNL